MSVRGPSTRLTCVTCYLWLFVSCLSLSLPPLPSAVPPSTGIQQWSCFKEIEHPHGILLGSMFPTNPRLMVVCDASPAGDAAAASASPGRDGNVLTAVGKKAITGTLKVAKLLLQPQHILSRLAQSRKSALHVIDGAKSKSIASVKVRRRE